MESFSNVRLHLLLRVCPPTLPPPSPSHPSPLPPPTPKSPGLRRPLVPLLWVVSVTAHPLLKYHAPRRTFLLLADHVHRLLLLVNNTLVCVKAAHAHFARQPSGPRSKGLPCSRTPMASPGLDPPASLREWSLLTPCPLQPLWSHRRGGGQTCEPPASGPDGGPLRSSLSGVIQKHLGILPTQHVLSVFRNSIFLYSVLVAACDLHCSSWALALTGD